MTKQELEDALARKQRSDTERLVFAGENSGRFNDWVEECFPLNARGTFIERLRRRLDAAMDAEERG